MPYSKQTWTDWAGDPTLAPTTAKFNAARANYMETGIANAQATADAALASSTDPEVVRDTMAIALVAGSGISISADDANNQITITNTGSSSGGTSTTGGAVQFAAKDATTGFWPVSYGVGGAPVYTGGAANTGRRPTTDPNVLVLWVGADPSPAIVTTGDGGELAGRDVRLVTP